MTKPLNKYIDHTLLKADATEEDIAKLCREALEYDFYSVCVNGCHVPMAKKLLADSDVKVAAVSGFPLGAMSTAAKLFEISQALADGADEIDLVMNIGAFKDGRHEDVLNETAAAAKLCHKQGAILKLIIETCLLTKDEIREACRLAVEAKVDFVKTSTGFSSGGADLEDIVLMHDTVCGQAQIKASGGIRSYDFAKALINEGADRLGCSASVAIIQESME